MAKSSVALITLAILGGIAFETGAAPIRRERRRDVPPEKWDKFVESPFDEDAFSLLEGKRPTDFGGPPSPPSPLPSPSGPPDDFDRRDMMKKLEGAENSMKALMRSDKSFKAGLEKIDETIDLVIEMRELFNNDPDYADDDTYLEHAKDMITYAEELKNHSKMGDYDKADNAFRMMRTTCNACHRRYR